MAVSKCKEVQVFFTYRHEAEFEGHLEKVKQEWTVRLPAQDYIGYWLGV